MCPPVPSHHTQPQELVEHTRTVLRPRRPLRVVLHRKRRQLPMPQSFNRIVIEVALAHVPTGVGRQGRAIDLELMVLLCHVHGPELGVANRVISPMMSKTEPRRGGARGLAEDLVPEADAEQRHALVE